mmetsp:Transcript_59273/g.139931  ORF Transcript_59273/g.139931 Transcript_59273/m.139931 type:complete len:212 (+) Transcript_59273:134-769(+)
MPSTVSLRAAPRRWKAWWTSSRSSRSSSARPRRRPRRTSSSVTAIIVGERLSSVAWVSRAQSSSAWASESRMAARSRWPKWRSMRSSVALGADTGARSARSMTLATTCSALGWAPWRRSSTRAGQCSPRTKTSPRPHSIASPAAMAWPVSASHSPTWPGHWARNQPPPTSGNRPMPVSGIASLERSLSTRSLAPWLMPMPPPMTMPSISAT